MLVFRSTDPRRRSGRCERALAADACPAVVAPPIGGRELLCAVVDAADRDPIDVAADARRALQPRARRRARRRQPPGAAGAACATPSTRRAARSRRPPSPTAARRRSPPGATSAPSPCCSRSRTTRRCRSTATACSGPIEQGDEEYGGELLRSLDVFIEHNGQWEKAARAVYCHRHTLRYRMRKVEELTGRDLSRAHDRIEFWLALRARELVAMKIGVPTEIKADEYRVAITPAGVRELTEHGHEVLIQAGAGDGSAIADDEFEAQGATIVADAADASSSEAELILHVKELQPPEIEMLRRRPAALHLPAPRAEPELTGGLCRLRCDLHRLRDRRGRARAGCRCWRR